MEDSEHVIVWNVVIDNEANINSGNGLVSIKYNVMIQLLRIETILILSITLENTGWSAEFVSLTVSDSYVTKKPVNVSGTLSILISEEPVVREDSPTTSFTNRNCDINIYCGESSVTRLGTCANIYTAVSVSELATACKEIFTGFNESLV